jgi:predicted HTH transcriptional regulator
MSVLRRVRESERMWADLEALLEKRRGLPERSIQGLFDATLGLRVRNASYRSVLKRFGAEDISHQVATSDLRALVEAGLLKQYGKKRGTYYVSAEPLEEIRNRARERRQQLDASSLFIAEANPAV